MRGVMRPILPVLLFALALPAQGADDAPTAITNVQVAPPTTGSWTPPRALTSHAVTLDDYPAESLAAREQGGTMVRYLVGDDGTVTEAKVISASGSSRLDEAAVAIVKRWRFQPALHNGKPEPMWVQALISFKLDDAAPPGLPAGATPSVALNSHVVVAADYPPESIRRGEKGCTMIRYLIQADGSVGERIIVTSSGYPKIDQAALSVVGRWRFRPAIQNGQPIAMWAQAGVIFWLHSGDDVSLLPHCADLHRPAASSQ